MTRSSFCRSGMVVWLDVLYIFHINPRKYLDIQYRYIVGGEMKNMTCEVLLGWGLIENIDIE